MIQVRNRIILPFPVIAIESIAMKKYQKNTDCFIVSKDLKSKRGNLAWRIF